uniref:TRPM SLOG domain-containing protein n=1 Tax=Knipowitschia caucasica TaxID=637954 RepID=A0AAV2J7V9_KNICA
MALRNASAPLLSDMLPESYSNRVQPSPSPRTTTITRSRLQEDAPKLQHVVGNLKAENSLSLTKCPSVQMRSYSGWIQRHVCKKECCYFKPSTSEGRCGCGLRKNSHVDEALRPAEAVESWDLHKHVREAPTDAYGNVCLGGLGHKTAKYVRVSSDTEPELLYELLTEQWKLPPPNLLISVTGGAKNFYLRARLKNMFHRGLIKVAQTTGAWILTGGTNTGVMKHVGQAVRDHALSSSMGGHIVAIGVATWGILHNRHTLINPKGCFPAYYEADVEGQGHLCCLDQNHTHFLLVDNGTHGQYEAEIQLRARLEKYISRKRLSNQASGVDIPVVCVVLDGGPGTLNPILFQTMYNAMLNGTPCVVMEGSGRIADVVAHVAELPVSRVSIALVQQLMKKFFGQEYDCFSDCRIIEWTKKIQDILRAPHLLTVFRITADSDGEVDMAILRALLKASRSGSGPGSGPGAEDSQRQLELAVAWNRVDIANTEIFTDERQWKSEQLHSAMLSALVGNKPEFVSLLLENGVSLWDFLQEETLCELYRQLPTCLFLRRLARRATEQQRRRKPPLGLRPRAFSTQSQTISLSHVSEEVRRLLGTFTHHIYSPTPNVYLLDMSTASDSHSKSLGSQNMYREESADPDRNPERDLFLWAILHNNKAMAQIAWEESRDSMAAALAASKILKKLSEEDKDADEAAEMKELATLYETQAMGEDLGERGEGEERGEDQQERGVRTTGRRIGGVRTTVGGRGGVRTNRGEGLGPGDDHWEKERRGEDHCGRERRGEDHWEKERRDEDHCRRERREVFSECFSCDEERAQKLLVRVSPFWGRSTCLRVALEANDQNFVAQSGVQTYLNTLQG